MNARPQARRQAIAFVLGLFLLAIVGTLYSRLFANTSPDLASLPAQLEQQIAPLEAKAEHGDVKTQIQLCSTGGGAPGFTDPIKWCRRCAEQGESGCQELLASYYREGGYVKQDYTEALKWLQKATEQGKNVGAQADLAGMYAEGQGVKQDYKQALNLYSKAADQYYPLAQFELGRMYAEGKGAKQDWSEAYFWWSLSARWYGKSAKHLDDAAKHLNSQQIADVQKRVHEWKPTPAPAVAPAQPATSDKPGQ